MYEYRVGISPLECRRIGVYIMHRHAVPPVRPVVYPLIDRQTPDYRGAIHLSALHQTTGNI